MSIKKDSKVIDSPQIFDGFRRVNAVTKQSLIVGDYIVWDIETDTSGGFGLDPRNGGIVSVAIGLVKNFVIQDGFFLNVDDSLTEKDLLIGVQNILAAAPDYLPLVGWNSSFFDAPFMFYRANVNELYESGMVLSHNPLLRCKYEPIPPFVGGYDHVICGLRGVDITQTYYTREWAGSNGLKSASLDAVANHLGFTGIKPDRTKIHELTPQELEAYNLSDITRTHALTRYWIEKGLK